MNTHLVQSRSFVLTLGLLTAMAALTVDLSLPAIPSMVDALDSTLTRGQQIVGIFMAGMAIGQIPAGLFSDRLGRMPTLYSGMALFAIAATVAAAASDMEWLLAARFVQGIGAASAVVLSRAIVRDVASGRDAARLMSLMTMIFTAAPVIAPTFGALLVAQWGWRAPFIAIAACAFLMIVAIQRNLVETHQPHVREHPIRQLASSFGEFFSHRQSIFGLLLLLLLPAGFLSVIAVSAALTVEIYGYSVQAYGLIFACAGLSILAGSALNRLLVMHFDQLHLIGISVGIIFVASAQLAIIAWLDSAPFWWLWVCVCLFMFTIAILMSNAMVVALDPLPRIAGVASSIVGTLQNLAGAGGALFAALIYDGSVRNAVIIMAAVGLLTTLIFLMRPLIAPGPFVHHPEELARD
ncbi:MAG: multidrug effflux MFS transporter [Gammaproteobacteria bacterium]|nr:multidrug effflux MFS transporter [Gammaproteobacteria bacterium]MBT8111771.1 multidrug effflux MFS transporter [Gammaproteobacteria bacterium]NND47169.1 multidrug effflux MFS transporter [Woeseiaceae bacterium]NNL46470.1 multidrug effflux MFS transporter [Woeseiaceae bacterium]